MRQLGSLEAPLAVAEDGGDKSVGCGRDYGCERVEGCLLPCCLVGCGKWTDGPMDDGRWIWCEREFTLTKIL